MHLAEWISVEHSEEVHEKIPRKVRRLLGIEHRLRKEELEERFNKEAKVGWRFAASAARITEEATGSEDRKHTSGGVFVAIGSNLGAVVGAEEGAIESIPGNEGRIAQAWVKRQRRIAFRLSLLLALERMDAEE